MTHLIGNEENSSSHGRFQRKRGNPPANVLKQSRNHNLQGSSTTLRKSRRTSCGPHHGSDGVIWSQKAGVTSCKPGYACSPLENAKTITSTEVGIQHSQNSECRGNRVLQERPKPASLKHTLNSHCRGNSVLHGEPESTSPASHIIMSRRNSGVCPTIERRAKENREPSVSTEVDELKQKLHDANLRLAEVVAQSVILVQDIQSAANKKIADVLSQAHILDAKCNRTRNLLAGQEQRFLFPSSTSFDDDSVNTPEQGFLEICPTCSRKVDINNARDAAHQDSQSNMSNCFQRGTAEEELLSTRQELADCRLMLAKMKQQLEQATLENERLDSSFISPDQSSLQEFKEACQNVKAACLAGSMRIEAEQCHRDFLRIEAFPGICEAECTLGKCVRMRGNPQRDTSVFNLKPDLQQPNLQKDHEYLAEAQAQITFEWTVLESVWEGAVQSLVFSIDSHIEPDLDPSIPHNMSSQSWTPEWSLSEEITPVKCSSNMTTPRLSCSGYGCKFPSVAQEAALRKNLIKSERRVEILTDNVEELKIVLQKVTALLHCISESRVGNGAQLLLRRIIEELRSFELGFNRIPRMLTI